MTTYTDVESGSSSPHALGSSFRHRRLVIGGRVLCDPVALARPAMRPREIAVLTRLLRQSKRVVEFGAGGSTLLALKLGVSHLVSVESDVVWIERIRAEPIAARAVLDRRLVLVRADIGTTGFLGGPAGRDAKEQWPNYARAPWPHLDADATELVFIDGRFRVSCILESILRVRDTATIAIHDFWNRPGYHSVLPFLDELDRCETLGVFRAKPDFSRDAAAALLSDAAYCPD